MTTYEHKILSKGLPTKAIGLLLKLAYSKNPFSQKFKKKKQKKLCYDLGDVSGLQEFFFAFFVIICHKTSRKHILASPIQQYLNVSCVVENIFKYYWF